MNYVVTRRAKTTHLTDPNSVFLIDESTAHLATLTARFFSKALNTRMSSYGVSSGQLPLLLHLWEDNGISQKDLSRRVNIEEPTAANTLNRMERDGLIERKRNPLDRREIRVHLTEKGESLKNDIIPFAKEVNSLATHGMSPEDKKRLNSLLAYVISRLASI